MDQFENREDGSSRECPDADDPSAKIYVSDDRVDFLRGVLAVIFGRHGRSYLPSYFSRGHAPRRAVIGRKKFHPPLLYYPMSGYTVSIPTYNSP